VDKATLGGLVLAIGGILLGLMLEGGNLSQVLQPTAAMIVFGGTLGAILIQYPLPVARNALQAPGACASSSPRRMRNRRSNSSSSMRTRRGAKASSRSTPKSPPSRNPFLRRALMLAVDGTESQELRKIMELELDNKEEQEEKIPQLFESAGGFSPTIGIIGAVLGLIQVMQHWTKSTKSGADCRRFRGHPLWSRRRQSFLLPCAGKLKIRIREEQIIREMTLEGVISILEGMNPRMLEAKLLGFLTQAARPAAERRRSPAHEPPQGNAGGPCTPITIAGWFPTPISSRCCSPSSWCSTPRRKWTREKSENWPGDSGRFQEMGVFQASTTKVPIDRAEPMPFSTVQAIENVERTASVAASLSSRRDSLGTGEENGDLAQFQTELETRWPEKSSARRLPCAATRWSGHKLAGSGFFRKRFSPDEVDLRRPPSIASPACSASANYPLAHRRSHR
jgi:chemotaxis protein MotA